jgi:hypothetical protein
LLAAAREQREEAKAFLRAGTDPGAHKRIESLVAKTQREVTFAIVAEELIALKKRDKKAAATINKIEWLLRLVLPLIGRRPISELAEKGALEILESLRRIEARGRLQSAKRCRSTIGQVFRYAIATGRATSDPTQALHGAIALPKVKHRAAILEPILFGQLLRDIDGYEASPITRACLQLMTLLFP